MMTKKAILLIFIISVLAIGLTADEKSDYEKGGKLFNAGKYEEALQLVEEAIKKYGDSPRWQTGKYYVLMALKRWEPALEVALKIENTSIKKNPYGSFQIARLYLLGKKNKTEALKWLETSAARGFTDFNALESDETFKPLQENQRFKALVKKMKEIMGIGIPPKDFTVTTLSGKSFTLSRQKGKVILVDFWATWCRPCIVEMPNLKKTYEKYHAKGFEIIGVSLDNKKENLNEYIKKENLGWQISFSGKGWGDETAALYSVDGIPSTWLVDKKGMLRQRDLRGEDLDKAIARLLEE
jgi:peroxiredoxin